MKNIISKAQDLGRKAAEIRQVVQGLPGQAAKIREAVTMTGGELQQLRADVQSSIHALRVDNEDRLLKTMREIHDHAGVFQEAGYGLAGMDLDLAVNQRLAVHLERSSNVTESALRALISRQTVESVRSILNSIVKAEETAATVEFSAVEYVGLVVHVGPLPIIRMHWRAPQKPNLATDSVQVVAAGSSAPPLVAASASASLGNIFEPRPIAPSVRIVSAPGASVAAGTSAAAASDLSPAKPESAWSSDALERFKRMPGASKYGR